MAKIHGGQKSTTAQQNQQLRKADELGKTKPAVQKTETKGTPKKLEAQANDAAIDATRAKDFASSTQGLKTGDNALNVRLGNAVEQTLDSVLDSVEWSTVSVAKSLMSDAELTAFQEGSMSPGQLLGLLAQAQQPMASAELQKLYPDFGEVYASMTAQEKAQCDAGQMTPVSFEQAQGVMWESHAADAEASIEDPGHASGPLKQPEDTKLYKPSDIRNRVKTGKGHNVMFGGQLMDRAVLGTMLDAMQGQGDGRVSRADMHKVLPKILDSGKISNAEENAMLFGLKYCRFTKPADRELAKAIGEKFSDSALARFGSLGQPPRFKDYEQYDMPMFAGREADLYGAKGVMTPEEMGTWQAGDMTLAQFNNVLRRANQPMSADALRETFGAWTANESEGAMTDAEFKRYDAGKMTGAEFQNIQYRAWEDESPSMKGKTPYQEDFKPGFKPFVADDVQDPKLRGLNQTLVRLNERLDAGDVDGMLALFDQKIVKEQLSFLTSEGQSLPEAKQQFLLEALNLRGAVSNLGQVEDISLDTSRVERFGPDSFNAFGVAILKNGDTTSANVLLNNDYSLTSAVG
ncbi:MAG: hypothetical protein ABIJ09_18745 [Pseudomonadota bacterium]